MSDLFGNTICWFSHAQAHFVLQGGPGGSGTGFGNFEEIGPLDDDLNPRKTTWVGIYLSIDTGSPSLLSRIIYKLIRYSKKGCYICFKHWSPKNHKLLDMH